ncbi:uncharacterized protein isoform X2 [Choristoneura fumiferana]|uniref:uncharacterized protein isoform X2 n=1 Tax=Choristoneura fumiferana TaxID=7141 RepID=UPI003D155A9E
MKWKNPLWSFAKLKWLMSGACSGDMSALGLKHAGEPTSDTKPGERRRGAAGRAAALRRAPSDSDCSGETASLSADSGERRPAPPPPRSGKTRGRRRGSEWEVLEGLKDGQRFERRPEVFNGYLHKKRKWPLKGWHKRFFVVDGGILVYARSPTDVARGRLHGSLDVGLSVISAKPRRRRIDIDADEFIYHLRAKTPDVFRTWLNVLKAHRLYRQHLLTFGARESVPKIHAPLDELPPTDTSSRISHSSAETFSTLTNTSQCSPDTKIKESPTFYLPTSRIQSSVIENKSHNSIKENSEQSSGLNINLETIDVEKIDRKLKTPTTVQNGSLCSMCCIEKRIQYKESTTQPSRNSSLNNDEEQIHSTNLDIRALKSMEPKRSSAQDGFKRTVSNFMSSFIGECNLNPSNKVSQSPSSASSSKAPQISVQSVRKHLTFGDKSQTTLFFFSRKNRTRENGDEEEWAMKRSKKSTNVVKYRNSIPEPLLKRPISKCMLLAKYKLNENESERQDKVNRGVLCDLSYPTQNKSIQDVMSPSEYDGITEKLILSIFDNHMEGEINNRMKSESPDSKFKGYVNQVVKELYNVTQCQSGCHPVTFLFRSLLDFYLRNTGSEKIKLALQKTKSVPKQSHKHFTKDAMISSEFINSATKETQVFEKRIEVRKCENTTLSTKSKPKGKKCSCEKETSPDPKSPKGDTDSFEKERRIQELERLMKNTVYLCETVQSMQRQNMQSKENDIKITKTLINNLSKMSKKSGVHKVSEEKRQRSDESTELPAIQDTINRLISETEMPPEMAKEFLHMYLDVLCNESSKHNSSSSRSSDTSKSCKTIGDALPSDGVQTESVIKKISKSVTARPNVEVSKPSFADDDQNKHDSIDPGQLYLQEMLDEITTVFTESRVQDSRTQKKDTAHEGGKDTIVRDLKRSRNSTSKNHIYEVKEDNSVVIDLSKYDLHRISMINDAASARMITVKIKLKEKPAEYGEWKRKHLSLKFSNDHPKQSQVKAATPWPRQVTGSSKQAELHFINTQAPFLGFDPKDQIELKPYLSTSDATSKGNHETLHGSGSFNFSIQSSEIYPHLSPSKLSIDSNDNAQCFLISSLKKKIKLQGNSKRQLNISRTDSPHPSFPKPPDGLTVFQKEPPGIINERFILLLLENLTLLSKNLPDFYKEISSMYVKLKKRYDETNTNQDSANLYLLGKNCKDNLNEKKLMFDGVTQYDSSVFPGSYHHGVIEAVQIAVNTSVLAASNNVVDKSVSAKELPIQQSKQCKQIEHGPSNPDMSKEKSIETQTSYTTCLTMSIENTAIRKDQAISIQEWCNKLTQECAISTVIKCFCNNEILNFAKPVPEDKVKKADNEIVVPKKFKKKHSSKIRQDLIKQIKLLSSSLKVSAQCQTEKKLNRHANCFEKDFRVFQLFPKTRCKFARSGSVTDSSVLTENKAKSDDLKTIYRCTSVPSFSSGLISPTAPPIRGPQAGFVSGTPGGRLASWIIESGGPLESASRELGQAQLSVQQLQRLLDALELQQQLHHDTDVSLEGASPNVKKDRRKFGLRKKKSNNKCGSVDLAPAHLDPSSSQMALSTLTAPPSPGGGASSMPNSAASLPIACAAARPQSLPGAEALATGGPTSLTSLTPDHQLREDFTVLAKDLVASLKTIVSTLVCERGRLRAAMEAAEPAAAPGGSVVAALRTNLSSALQQNSVLNVELRSRLSRIHDASDLAELSSVGNNSDPAARQFPQSLSYSSSCVSASEFFDAEEHDDDLKPAEIIATDEAGVIELDGDSSSEAGSLSSEEGSASSDNSDGATSAVIPASRPLQNGSAVITPRRVRLPCPRPTPASPSLWNLLYKNIGKDLSQISMPVTINEPLNMLQRLCEELEYSELLDAASECSNEIDRMALIAAFAVSAYAASAHRAASKPFNPLLGETYECVRPDRDFRFIAEQVSHHPPISACHAESPRWTFWQEARIKTKFWGKSMEFQPTGRVHVRLAPSGDHYSWNKVTTCVHNLFGGQRWVDQYGDMHIAYHGTDITCKLNFVKASSWSGNRHEVRGAVLSGGAARARLQGRWSEGLHAQDRPLWRTGAMPADYELYYGFTRFAMELNELEPGMREILPNTDTRLRPDQRALEEGDVDAAEQFKLELEQAQRERRRDGAEHRASWFRKSVEDGEETWVFTGEYWKAREAGFGEGPRLW